jgi:hypothetical protein
VNEATYWLEVRTYQGANLLQVFLVSEVCIFDQCKNVACIEKSILLLCPVVQKH